MGELVECCQCVYYAVNFYIMFNLGKFLFLVALAFPFIGYVEGQGRDLEITEDCRQRNDTGETQCLTEACERRGCAICIPNYYTSEKICYQNDTIPNNPTCEGCDGFTTKIFTITACWWRSEGWQCESEVTAKSVHKDELDDSDWFEQLQEETKEEENRKEEEKRKREKN